MKSDRLFYTVAGALFLVVMIGGFHPFITGGRGEGGRIISPAIFPLVLTHGLAIAAWYLLFFVQSLLITVRKRRLHMTLGWAGVPVALTIAYTGSMTAIRSVQITPPAAKFFGMPYSEFLLLMLTEIAAFTLFFAAGILTRKRPKVHRAMMVVASFCLLSGATSRMRFLEPVFPQTSWLAMFAPMFLLGVALILLRFLMDRKLDRGLIVAYAVYVVITATAGQLALTPGWDHMAMAILRP